MLKVRLAATAALLIPTLTLVWLDAFGNFGHPGLWLGVFALIASQMACAETISLVCRQDLAVSRRPAHLGTLCIVLCALAPIAWKQYPPDCVLGKPGWALLGFGLAISVVLIDEMLRFRSPGTSITRMSHTMFVVIYTGGLMAFVVELRILAPAMRGLLAFVGTAVVVKLSDAGAYFVGRAIGKTKISRILSPKKTLEGCIGGIVTACAGAAFVFYVLGPLFLGDSAPKVSILICCLYGATVALAGMIGDLFESLLKRDSETKDSSQWLPGLGGVLDILDSVYAAAPVSFVWWVSGLLD